MSHRMVIRYRAKDGSEWTSDERAAKRNALIDACYDAMGRLKPRPSNSFRGYVQQEASVVHSAMAAIIKIADDDGRLSKHWDIKDATKVARCGIMMRIIGEMEEPLARSWGRLACIDSNPTTRARHRG